MYMPHGSIWLLLMQTVVRFLEFLQCRIRSMREYILISTNISLIEMDSLLMVGIAEIHNIAVISQ